MNTLIVNAKIVNEGKVVEGDVLIRNERIEKISPNISEKHATVVDAGGHFLLPGFVDRATADALVTAPVILEGWPSPV